MLKSFGIEKVQVLSGGFQTAEKEGIQKSGEEILKNFFYFERKLELPTSTLEEVEKKFQKILRPS